MAGNSSAAAAEACGHSSVGLRACFIHLFGGVRDELDKLGAGPVCPKLVCIHML